jgi:hypothetical protein
VSESANIQWEQKTGVSWLGHSQTRWFSMYNVVEFFFKYFGDMPSVLTELVNKNISPASAGKLFILFQDDKAKHYARIELSTYVEGLYALRNFCY